MRKLMTMGLLFWLAMPALHAADAKKKPDEKKEKEPETPRVTKGTQMDYGQFLSYSVKTATHSKNPLDANIACKGISIKLDKAADTVVCFDADLMRYSAGWTGGFLDITKTNIGDLKGTEPATIKGTVKFSTKPGPGWSKNASFTDPRTAERGPLPKDWAHYKGLYLHGSSVVLSYSVGDCDVLESPGAIQEDGEAVFTRTIQTGKSTSPLGILICESDGGKVSENSGGVIVVEGSTPIAVKVIGAPEGAKLDYLDNSKLVLTLPAQAAGASFKIALMNGPKSALAKVDSAKTDLAALCKGGPARWTEAVTTKGVPGKDDGPYVQDILTLPETNPWNAWMRASALDFLSDGRAVVSTLNGDVWLVSGIDATLEKLVWKRFATGLYEPLGLKVVDDNIYVLGRDQITRLHDLNNDGEADYYENFNNDSLVSPIYHAFAFDLQTDSRGDFYYARGGNQVEHDLPDHSAMLRVSKDGQKMDVFATGFRAPNGMGIGPNDEIVCGDNQGHWIGSSKINLVKKGGFYGYMGDPRRADPKHIGPKNTEFDQPLVWIPYAWDNSCGGQVFVTSDKWGPLKGHMLHMSYGKCALFDVMSEEAAGYAQGAIVKLPIAFASGVMRARFSPKDGQLYACGLKGWQTSGARDGTLSRVRYTGKPLELPHEFHVTREGIQIVFSEPVDAETAADPQNYSIEQWNYTWTKEYNAPEVLPTAHHDPVACEKVKISADKKTVTLLIAGLKPVMQMMIKMKIKSASGDAIDCTVANTINRVP